MSWVAQTAPLLPVALSEGAVALATSPAVAVPALAVTAVASLYNSSSSSASDLNLIENLNATPKRLRQEIQKTLRTLVLSVCSLLPLLLVRQGEPLEDGLLPLPFVPRGTAERRKASLAPLVRRCSLNL